MIPLSERHLRTVLQEWVAHDNRGRPHASLGPGIPIRLAIPATGRQATIGFARDIAWLRIRFSADFIMSIVSLRWPPEPTSGARRELLRTQVYDADVRPLDPVHEPGAS